MLEPAEVVEPETGRALAVLGRRMAVAVLERRRGESMRRVLPVPLPWKVPEAYG